MAKDKENEKRGDKLQFPLCFDKCPNPACGHKEGLIKTAMREEGFLGKDQKMALQTIQMGLVDPVAMFTRPVVSVLRILTEACPKCGMVYVTHVEKQLGQVVGPGPGPGAAGARGLAATRERLLP